MRTGESGNVGFLYHTSFKSISCVFFCSDSLLHYTIYIYICMYNCHGWTRSCISRHSTHHMSSSDPKVPKSLSPRMSLEAALTGAVKAEVYLQSNEPEARQFFKAKFGGMFCW